MNRSSSSSLAHCLPPPLQSGGDLPNGGYAPFNAQVLNEKLFVTYALHEPFKQDVAGAGNGFVDEFSLSEDRLARVASNKPGGSRSRPLTLASLPATC